MRIISANSSSLIRPYGIATVISQRAGRVSSILTGAPACGSAVAHRQADTRRRFAQSHASRDSVHTLPWCSRYQSMVRTLYGEGLYSHVAYDTDNYRRLRGSHSRAIPRSWCIPHDPDEKEDEAEEEHGPEQCQRLLLAASASHGWLGLIVRLHGGVYIRLDLTRPSKPSTCRTGQPSTRIAQPVGHFSCFGLYLTSGCRESSLDGFDCAFGFPCESAMFCQRTLVIKRCTQNRQ
jgi:hypothetical protein